MYGLQLNAEGFLIKGLQKSESEGFVNLDARRNDLGTEIVIRQILS